MLENPLIRFLGSSVALASLPAIEIFGSIEQRPSPKRNANKRRTGARNLRYRRHGVAGQRVCGGVRTKFLRYCFLRRKHHRKRQNGHCRCYQRQHPPAKRFEKHGVGLGRRLAYLQRRRLHSNGQPWHLRIQRQRYCKG